MAQRTPEEKARSREMEIAFLEGVRSRLPQNVAVWESLGCLYTEMGRFDDGLQADRQVVQMHPNSAVAWYNLACSLALTQGGDATFEALDKAVALGYDDVEWMERDGDLDAIREDPRYIRLFSMLRATVPEE
ncbi:MAG: hypothetical protein LBN38_03190 [Verrucomicrobiota bacterium]|jgi:cytochrome c-type biogenesis protein CcmH/NrfG|nr:hypothetical protein [Verrucomicrobiota bacterium]